MFAPSLSSGVVFASVVSLSLALPSGMAAREPIPTLSRDPYLGAIVMDSATGNVIFEEKADTQGYPASMLKLMDLLIILEKVEAGSIKLTDPVTVTAESARIGGSQVYLKENEVFSIEDLLYALMVQSANDAAAALAIHVSGTPEAFVELMNRRARELGMKSTTFHSVHGLPPGTGQKPDVTTARDMALLCREVLKHPEALKYTSTRRREFRTGAKEPFIMQTHNNLMATFEGCDGLKTGYFKAAGYSVAATAARGGKRVIAVVLGSPQKKTRDTKARELLARSFSSAPSAPAVAEKKAKPVPAPKAKPASLKKGR